MSTALRPRALIADDETLLAADLGERLRALWPELDIVATVHNGDDALARLDQLRPDIAFLDIRMPGLDGLQVAARAQPAHWVFVTAYDAHAVEAFERAAVDYVLKPVSDDRLRRTVERLQARVGPPVDARALLERLERCLPPPASAPLNWVRASAGQDVHLVPLDDIMYFHADDKYTTVVTREREYLIRTPLKDLLPRLDPERFWRIHRSTIVNTRYIVSARRDLSGRVHLTLKHGATKLVSSRAYASLFQQM